MALTARGPREAWRREQLAKAHSASPRPQRLRAVDAVKLAKRELEGPIVKAGRLRLASVLDDGLNREKGPVLHEGFYKLAATVTRPEPSLRQKATTLQKSLEVQLQRLRTSAGDWQQGPPGPIAALEVAALPPPALPALEGEAHVDTFITQEEPSIEPDVGALVSVNPTGSKTVESSAELARKELELVVDTLLSYARETSSDCRERKALLDSLGRTAASSIEKFTEVVQRQSAEALEAEQRVDALKARIQELEEDTEGLRRVVQQMLKDEAELRKETEEKVAEVKERQQQLTEAEHRSDHLSVQLHKAMEKLHLQEELQREAREKLRDGCNSPMMHFTTFILGPDQVPPSGVNIGSGEVSRDRMDRTRTDKSQAAQWSGDRSGRNSMMSASGHSPPAFARSRSESQSQVCSRSLTPDMVPESSSEEQERLPVVKKVSSRRRLTQEESSGSESDEPPRPSPLAVSFPALVPYLDFQKDAESNKIKAQTAAQNHEHLEKHMVLLQEERQKHIEQNKLLQEAVDSTLERLLVWVQAAFDSLTDFGPESVQQDSVALAAIRDMLAWLAERTCKAWLEPPANLAQALHSHEERVRQALDLAEKESSNVGRRSEVDELRKALQEQTQRVEEMEQRLQEAVLAQESLSFSRGLASTSPVPGLEQELSNPLKDLGAGSLGLVGPAGEQSPEVAELEDGEPTPVEDRGEEVKEAQDAQEEEYEMARTSAALQAEQEAQRMRLFRCPFAESVDLTYVKRDRQFPYTNMEDPDDNKRLGRRQLRHFISEVYTAKRLEDRRRDKASQPRRLMHFIMQEMLRRQHGVKSLVHQRSWQLMEAVAEHASSDVAVGLFADFLDGTRDLDELSFYLYCLQLIATVPEEPQAMPPSRLPPHYVSESRRLRLVDLLFSDLPKAKAVVQEEIEKQVPDMTGAEAFGSLEELSHMSFDDVPSTRCIETDALCRAFLEGWRVCCLLLSKSMPHFSWRDTILAFIQADVHGRGWLDPHEVSKAEVQPALAARARSQDLLPVTDQTSLGAFVFRIVNHLGGLTEASLKEDVIAETAFNESSRDQENCLQLCLTAFGSLERSLGVYLKWLLHSEEPRDRAVYKCVTGRIFAVRRAASLKKSWPMMHNLRSLLVLLLSHQFDLQLIREEAQPEHVGWELTALLQVLRESWRRGARNESGADGPDFGPELEEVGESEFQDVPGAIEPLANSPVSGREKPPIGHSVSFTVGKKWAQQE